MKMESKKKLSFNDFFMLLIVVFTLAFRNYSRILAIVQLIGCFVVYISNFKKGKIKNNKIIYLIWKCMFLIWSFFSLFWAEYSSNVIALIVSVLEVTMVGFGVILYIDDNTKIDRILNFVKIGSLILIARMIMQVPFNAWGTDRVGIYIGYGGNGAANVLSYAALLMYYYYKKTNKKQNIIYSIIFVAFALLCGSKKAVIIVIIGIGLQMILNSNKPIQTFKNVIKVVLIVLTLTFAIMNFEPLYNVLGIRFEKMFLALSGQTGGDMSTKDRILFAEVAYNVFKNHPLLGVGLDNYRYYNYMQYYAHNNYLELVADLGIIGFILYYWFIFKNFIVCLKNYKNKNFVFCGIFILIVLIMDIANVSYYLDSIQLYIAIIYGMILVFINQKDGEINEEKIKFKNIKNN